jgi:hypothetical protein
VLPAATFAWLLTPFASGMLVGRSERARAAVARHLGVCLAVGWAGVAAFVWGATALDEPAGSLAFLAGGPLGGLSFWSRSPGSDEPPEDPAPPPPEWDWEQFSRELREYDRERSPA